MHETFHIYLSISIWPAWVLADTNGPSSNYFSDRLAVRGRAKNDRLSAFFSSSLEIIQFVLNMSKTVRMDCGVKLIMWILHKGDHIAFYNL